MIVRNAEKRDVQQILGLLNSAEELKTSKGFFYSPAYVESHLTNPVNEIIVCEDDSIIIGALTAEVWKDKGYAFISNIIVREDFRMKGAASLMYGEFEKNCKLKKIRSINFLVKTSNKIMHDWAEKRGFEREEQFFFYEKKI